MGTHIIPRDVEGEGRILIIFSAKGFIGTLVGIVIGGIFHGLFSAIGAPVIGWIMLAICGLLGFVIMQVKLPRSNSFEIMKKAGGDYIYEIILNYFKFRKKRKLYTYDKGGMK